jgi:hypothetical protein
LCSDPIRSDPAEMLSETMELAKRYFDDESVGDKGFDDIK